jgi:hypothetical protein
MASVQRRNGSRDLDGGGAAATFSGCGAHTSFIPSTPGSCPCLGGIQPTFASFQAASKPRYPFDRLGQLQTARSPGKWRSKTMFTLRPIPIMSEAPDNHSDYRIPREISRAVFRLRPPTGRSAQNGQVEPYLTLAVAGA